MKRMIAILIAAMFITALTAPVSVHAGGHHHDDTHAKYSLCHTKNCNTSTEHKHNGKTYSGHYIGDGHSYHKVCDVKSCTKTANHKHNGTVCFPHAEDDGHSYHKKHDHRKK
jgi:hypothetical protein